MVKCVWRDSNSHALRHQILSLGCLPISPQTQLNDSNHIASWVYLSWGWICATFHPFTTASITTYATPIFNIHLKRYVMCNHNYIGRTSPPSFQRICFNLYNALENHLCIKRDSNSHVFQHQVLNLGRLPFRH